MFRVRKLFKFEAAHRLTRSYTKCCQTFHGHSYKVEVIVTTCVLNDDGMVIDFGELKKIVDPFIKEWDHSLILHENDSWLDDIPSDCKVIIMPWNPTAENMAKYLAIHIAKKKAIKSILHYDGYSSLTVRIHETDTGWAEYTIKGDCRK